MQTQVRKKTISLLLFISLFANAFSEITHGSLKDSGLILCAQYSESTIKLTGVTFEFKVLSNSSKSWCWTNTAGTIITNSTYSSQLHHWNRANSSNSPEILSYNIRSSELETDFVPYRNERQ